MWASSHSAGAVVHSSSWGYEECVVEEECYFNDKYLVEVSSRITRSCNTGHGATHESSSEGCPSRRHERVSLCFL